MRYKAVLFDLDGTLLDTLEDLADSMNEALRQLKYPTHDVKEYRYFVGDGIKELARRVLPSDQRNEATVNTSKELMSEEYGRRWNTKTKPYPGIEELLDALTVANVKMAVFSNKPDDFVKIMVPELLPRWTFYPIFGARQGVPVKPNPQGAFEIAKLLELEPEQFLYIGDTNTDMCTATAVGMYAVGVSWGFRPVRELVEHGAKTIIHHPLDLMKLFDEKAMD